MLKRAFFYLNTNGFDACLIKMDSIFHFLFVMVKYQDFFRAGQGQRCKFYSFLFKIWHVTVVSNSYNVFVVLIQM